MVASLFSCIPSCTCSRFTHTYFLKHNFVFPTNHDHKHALNYNFNLYSNTTNFSYILIFLLISTFICSLTFKCVYYICMYPYIYLLSYVIIQPHLYIHVPIYIYIYTRTYILIYGLIYTQSSILLRYYFRFKVSHLYTNPIP